MLLKSLKLFNFRQFKGQQDILFSIDPNKNVTVIMGENGSGKTSLAQAFTWCLYGDTDFDDKSMLNKIIEQQMLPENEDKVKVELNLTHNEINYTIVREQNYKKDLSGKVKAANTSFYISYKKDGQQEFLKPHEAEIRMKQILPKELSRYFFFDGERIGKMSKEIKKGKSQDFAQAVRGLLGLNAFIAAIEHLKPSSKYGVIGSYNESFDASGDKKISQYRNDINSIQEKIDIIDNRLIEIEDETQKANDKCEELSILLMKNAESEKLHKEKEKLKSNIEDAKKVKTAAIITLLKTFNTYGSSYFAKSLIKDSLEELSKAEKLDQGIPDMHARTIEFLIKRGKCVCGNNIEVGNDAYMQLNKSLEYLPPQSIGIMISQFLKESEMRTKINDLYEDAKSQYSIVRSCEKTIDNFQSDIQNIEMKLVGEDNSSNIQKDLMRYENIIRGLSAERDELNKNKGGLETNLSITQSQLQELTLRSEKNRKIEVYKAYAQSMHEELTKIYKENEDNTRKLLEKNINEIFKELYKGGMSLTIDEKYNIQVYVDEYNNTNLDVETSTAQNISVIFAFITGIIKMARDNKKKQDADVKMLDSEPYPLVMDAPLSAFDKRRIKSVCDALPKIAEQVIIFIKDTDGEIAEDNMNTKIGKQYLFDKKNEFETHLMKRG